MTFMARNIVAINSPDIKLILTYFCYIKPIIKNHADNSLNKIIYIYNFMNIYLIIIKQSVTPS